MSFYPHNIEDTYLEEIIYNLILVDDYTSLNEGVVTWKDEMSFEMTGSIEKIKAADYYGVKMIGFPDMSKHSIMSLNNHEEAYRLNIILEYMKEKNQQQR